MEVLLTHVAGVDVHKDMIMTTTLIGAAGEKPLSETFECTTFTEDLRRCGEKLLALGIKHVAMESTGVYWKPIYNVWKPMGLIITLGNAYHIKNVPGRKTDVKDSQWIAQLHRNGLIQASYVPDVEFQQYRALTRHRSGLVNDTTRVKNRLRKVLEDGNIKLGSMLSDVFGVSSLAILRAIADGVDSPASLAIRVTTNIKRKEDIIPALTHCLRDDHKFLIKQYLAQYDGLQSMIADVELKIEAYFERHSNLIERLDEIPGVDKLAAQGIIAEATTNMKVFKDDRTFAAWAGVAPGNNESARKKKDPRAGTGAPT
jgi:transposase